MAAKLPADYGEAANAAARQSIFVDYLMRKSAQTRRQQLAGLNLFAAFLSTHTGIERTGLTLQTDPSAWLGITWGLVDAFQKWLILQGYAISTVNVRVTTVKIYAKLAYKAYAIPDEEYLRIAAIVGYSHTEAKRIDEQRQHTRRLHANGQVVKKADAILLTTEQALQLMQHPATPQGRRDSVLTTLLLEHGLRVGELAALKIQSVELAANTMTFYRAKVDKTQTHAFTPRSREALQHWLELDVMDAAPADPLLRSSRKGGHLMPAGMSINAITRRVRYLGQRVGVIGLSAHDCRHYWATQAARNGTPLDRLMDAGGWNSPAMPMRYIEAAHIANEGVKLE